MRKIKFRGKTVESAGLRQAGEWAYGGYFVDDCYGGCPEGKHHIVEFNSTGMGYYSHTKVIKETVGQFTGCRDMAKKEVYEGDIVDTDDGYAVVKYDEAFAQFYIDYRHSRISFMNYFFMEYETFVVVGNIHDTPELLSKMIR